MPEDKIIIDADVKPLKSQLKGAIQDLQVARQKFGEMSDQAIAAAKKVGAIKDAIQDAGEQAKLFDPGSRFQALTTAASTAAGGVAAVQGAMALFGKESEDVQKTLVKLQGAMALSQGLSQLKDIGKVGDGLISSFKGLTAGANGFKKALISTGIGALVVAVGVLVAYWDDIKRLVNGVNKETEKQGLIIDKQITKSNELLDIHRSTLETQKLNGKTEKEILQTEIKLTDELITQQKAKVENLKLSLKDVSLAQTKFQAVLAAANLSFVKNIIGDPLKVREEGLKVIKEQEKVLIELENSRASSVLRIKDIDEKAVDEANAKAVKNKDDKKKADEDFQKYLAESAEKIGEELKKKQEEQAATEREYQISLNKIKTETRLAGIKDENEKAREAIKADYEQQRADIDADEKLGFLQKFNLKKALTEQENIALETLKAEQETKRKEELFNEDIADLDRQMVNAANSLKIQKDLIDEKERLNKQGYINGIINEEQFTKNTEEITKARIELAKQEANVKTALLASTSQALTQAGDLLGRETGTGKTLAVAASLMNTYAAITGQLKAFSGVPIPGYAIVQAIATGLAGFAAVRNILKVQVPKGGGGGSVPSMSAPSLSATSIPTLGASPVTAIASVINRQPPIRAFVVESEVTGTQRRVADIERRAGF